MQVILYHSSIHFEYLKCLTFYCAEYLIWTTTRNVILFVCGTLIEKENQGEERNGEEEELRKGNKT